MTPVRPRAGAAIISYFIRFHDVLLPGMVFTTKPKKMNRDFGVPVRIKLIVGLVFCEERNKLNTKNQIYLRIFDSL